MRHRIGVGALLAVATLWLVPATPATADYPYGARGEVARLGRQLYDFHYRGRHLSQDSIRYTGRPLHHGYTNQRIRPYPSSYRRHYASHAAPYAPYASYASYAPSAAIQPIYIIQEAPPPRPERLTREDIEMVPVGVAVEPRKPTQKAVLEQVTLADGTVRAFIRSVPIESGRADDAEAAGTAIAAGADAAEGS